MPKRGTTMSRTQKKKIAKSVANYHANACRKWENKYERLKSQVEKTNISRYKSRRYKNTADQKYEGSTSRITRVAPGGGKIVKQKLADRKKADKKKAEKQKRRMFKVIKEKKLNTENRRKYKALIVELKKEKKMERGKRWGGKTYDEKDRAEKLAEKIYALAKKSGDIKPISVDGGKKKIPYLYEALREGGRPYRTYWKAIGINLRDYREP
tara:strand:- start:2187 stop:2819 length:633 start_codon:yes stop_codon:yes gene_type:complete